MKVSKTREGNKLIVALEGRLDTLSSPDLEEELDTLLDGVETLIFDFAGLVYLSSAGLRVLVNAAQVMDARDGKMKVINANDYAMEIFEVTGLIDSLDVE